MDTPRGFHGRKSAFNSSALTASFSPHRSIREPGASPTVRFAADTSVTPNSPSSIGSRKRKRTPPQRNKDGLQSSPSNEINLSAVEPPDFSPPLLSVDPWRKDADAESGEAGTPVAARKKKKKKRRWLETVDKNDGHGDDSGAAMESDNEYIDVVSVDKPSPGKNYPVAATAGASSPVPTEHTTNGVSTPADSPDFIPSSQPVASMTDSPAKKHKHKRMREDVLASQTQSDASQALSGSQDESATDRDKTHKRRAKRKRLTNQQAEGLADSPLATMSSSKPDIPVTEAIIPESEEFLPENSVDSMETHGSLLNPSPNTAETVDLGTPVLTVDGHGDAPPAHGKNLLSPVVASSGQSKSKRKDKTKRQQQQLSESLVVSPTPPAEVEVVVASNVTLSASGSEQQRVSPSVAGQNTNDSAAVSYEIRSSPRSGQAENTGSPSTRPSLESEAASENARQEATGMTSQRNRSPKSYDKRQSLSTRPLSPEFSVQLTPSAKTKKQKRKDVHSSSETQAATEDPAPTLDSYEYSVDDSVALQSQPGWAEQSQTESATTKGQSPRSGSKGQHKSKSPSASPASRRSEQKDQMNRHVASADSPTVADSAGYESDYESASQQSQHKSKSAPSPSAPRRSRGRPRKSVPPADFSDDDEKADEHPTAGTQRGAKSASSPSAPRRSRRRPRKSVPPADLSDDDEMSDEYPPAGTQRQQQQARSASPQTLTSPSLLRRQQKKARASPAKSPDFESGSQPESQSKTKSASSPSVPCRSRSRPRKSVPPANISNDDDKADEYPAAGQQQQAQSTSPQAMTSPSLLRREEAKASPKKSSDHEFGSQPESQSQSKPASSASAPRRSRGRPRKSVPSADFSNDDEKADEYPTAGTQQQQQQARSASPQISTSPSPLRRQQKEARAAPKKSSKANGQATASGKPRTSTPARPRNRNSPVDLSVFSLSDMSDVEVNGDRPRNGSQSSSRLDLSSFPDLTPPQSTKANPSHDPHLTNSASQWVSDSTKSKPDFEAAQVSQHSGPWLAEEIETLEANIEDYLKHHEDQTLESIVFGSKEQRKGFYIHAAQNIRRPLFSVYTYIRRRYGVTRKTGRFSAEEEEQLMSLVKEHGHKWTMISGIMNRAANALCAKYNLMKERQRVMAESGEVRRGWEPEDNELLEATVRLLSRKDEGPVLNVPWHGVAQYIPGKTADQCRLHWVGELGCVGVAVEWSKDDELQLIHAICNSDDIVDGEIPWQRLQAEYWPDIALPTLKSKWARMRCVIPNSTRLPLTELLRDLLAHHS